MQGFSSNIKEDTTNNTNFRQVIYTGEHTQLVLMCLEAGSEIGSEVHGENDQFFRFELGQGRVTIDGTDYDISPGSAVIVPAGAEHNVVNVSDSEPLKLYTLYSPAHHSEGTIHATKAEADEAEHDHKQ